LPKDSALEQFNALIDDTVAFLTEVHSLPPSDQQKVLLHCPSTTRTGFTLAATNALLTLRSQESDEG
jgi:hypothetical protein